MELTDQQLAENYLKGEQNALDSLIARYLSPVYNFVFKYVHTVEAAEDVTQEVMLKVWKNFRSYNPDRKFSSWIFTIAKNTALDHLKKRGLVPFSELEKSGHLDSSQFLEVFLTKGDLPEQALAKITDLQMIGHALAKMPQHYQQVVDLYYSKQLNFREISEMLNESINTVKTRHRRAILYLRDRLK